MRVLINGLSTAGVRTGIGHYTAQLVRCLRDQVGPEDTLGCFPAPWIRGARAVWGKARPWLQRHDSPSSGPSGAATNSAKSGGRLMHLRNAGQAFLARHFQAMCRRGDYQLYHEPNFIPLPSDIPAVVTICDLSVLLHPEWHPADRVAHFEREFHEGLSRTSHFLAISESCRQELINHLGLQPDRVTCTYMGIRPGLCPLPDEEVRKVLHDLGLPPRYLLYLGTMEPRKNILTLLRAYCALPGKVRDEYPLVLVGSWGWKSEPVVAYLDAEARHRGVRHIGYLPEKQLGAVYNGARALIFPSFYEGFGLPPLEMMACGGAVLASTADAMEELVGGQAHLVEPLDLDGWREALLRVTTDDDWWKTLRHGAEEVARPYTWDRCARDTLAVYREVIEGTTARDANVRRAG